jgi:excisionase family DNA binding protein
MMLVMDISPDSLVSTAEAAAILGLERSTVLRWVREGRIAPAMKVSGKTGTYLFRRADVEAKLPEAHPRRKAG